MVGGDAPGGHPGRRRAVRAENNVQRLQEDHDNAAWMAEQLRVSADVTRHDTNMLFVPRRRRAGPGARQVYAGAGVLINASPVVRLVTHLMSTVSS